MREMETKEQVQKALFNIENFDLPRYLYKLNTHSMKVFNSHYDIEYMYKVIQKIADKSNLEINLKVKELYESSISREIADEIKDKKWFLDEYANHQFNNFVRMYILLKDLLKVVENDFTLELNFYNNTYFSKKADVKLHAKLRRVEDGKNI